MNYKIKVANEAESEEVQKMFFELGYVWLSGCESTTNVSYPYLYTSKDMGLWSGSYHSTFNKCGRKQITIPQLRDLVVLKRNDVGDANYIRPRDGKEYFKSSQNNFYHMIDGEWIMSTWENGQLEPQLKPIEKPMKEFLDTEKLYTYVQDTAKRSEDWIEVPEGAEDYRWNKLFYKDNGRVFFTNGGEWEESMFSDFDILWQRNKPESLIDKVEHIDCRIGRIEEVKHNHYFKDVSDIESIDVYEVLKRFGVTDPCLQHIVKKALCAGQRGHKDFAKDLQDILDTAIRAVEINN